jgi:polar amino acid transport system substrate-binding protein
MSPSSTGAIARALMLAAALAVASAPAWAQTPRGSLDLIRARKSLRVGTHARFLPFAALGPDAEALHQRIGAPLVRAVDGRMVAGFDVDLAQAAARALGVTLEIVIVDRFDDLLPGLVQGRYDVVMSGLTRTLERAAIVAFSDPYFASGLQILVRDPLHLVTVADLVARRVRVGVRAATTAQSFAARALAGTQVRTFASEAALFAAVDAGALDAVVLDYVTARDAELRGVPQVRLTPLEERHFTLEHFAFAVRHGDHDWLDWLNLMLRESKSTGEFHVWAARYNVWFRSEQ